MLNNFLVYAVKPYLNYASKLWIFFIVALIACIPALINNKWFGRVSRGIAVICMIVSASFIDEITVYGNVFFSCSLEVPTILFLIYGAYNIIYVPRAERAVGLIKEEKVSLVKRAIKWILSAVVYTLAIAPLFYAANASFLSSYDDRIWGLMNAGVIIMAVALAVSFIEVIICIASKEKKSLLVSGGVEIIFLIGYYLHAVTEIPSITDRILAGVIVVGLIILSLYEMKERKKV